MNLPFYVRLWGALDVAYVLWRAIKDISDSKFPFVGAFSESVSASEGFGQMSILILTLIGAVITLSIVLSGPLMLALRRTGVYISLVQFPCRLIFLVPPTFFFIQSAREYLPSLLLVAAIIILEVIKAITEVLWLKKRNQSVVK